MTDTADRQRWARVGELFGQALALPVEQREAFLAQACGGDEALKAEVGSLVSAEAQAALLDALAPPTDADVARWLDAPVNDALLGKQLGSTTLARRIASGGMGVVYEGVQDPPGRKVAVKLLRSALAGEAGRIRFQHEARLLANLRHPGIAQIYEAGTHVEPGGEQLPYFVMEYVPGARTLVEHAQRAALTLPERLRLFARVCDAVHVGHAKGVIHRDLKPGNILVDADGNPKVIDFGIARSMEEDPATPQPRTQTGQLVGTLPYMSPEQVLGAGADLDTRSDVYALGVILYELLTGKLPYELDGLGLMEAVSAIARRPPTPPAKLNPALAGDLTVVLEKALAKDPGLRYASAAALGQDLERYLTSTPILARPPSLVYQLRLFTRRHKGLVASAAITVLALVVATVWSLVSARDQRLARQAADVSRQRAEHLLAQTRSLVPWLLKDLSRDLARKPGTLAARVRLAERIRDHVDALAVTERDDLDVLRSAAMTRWALGDVLGGEGRASLGRRDEALAQYGEAVRLLDQALARAPGDRDTDLARCRVRLAQSRLVLARGDVAGARAIIAEVEALGERWLAQAPEDESGWRVRLAAWDAWAALHWSQFEREAGVEVYRRILALRESGRRFTGESDQDVRQDLILARLNVGTGLLELGRAEEAQGLLTRLSEEAQASAGSDPDMEGLGFLRLVESALGVAWEANGQHERARPHLERALAHAERVAALDSDNADAQLRLQGAHHHLGLMFSNLGDFASAVPHLRLAVDLGARTAGNQPPGSDALWDLRVERALLARALQETGRLAEAEAELRTALRLAQERVTALPQEDWAARGVFEVWSALGRLESARIGRPEFKPAALARHVPWLVRHLGWPAGEAGAEQASWALWMHSLKKQRACFQAAREALLQGKARGAWNERFAADLAKAEDILASIDKVLAPPPR